MNSEDQRLAIAKTLGFDISYVEDALERFRDRDGYPDAIFQLAKIPDWPTNLNAAIQLCDVLKAEGWNCKIYRFAQVGTLWAVELTRSRRMIGRNHNNHQLHDEASRLMI
jgi:hypothetical protein